MAKPTFQLEIISPTETLFQGTVTSLSALNDSGPFDVLPHHANFISVVHKKLSVREVDCQPQNFIIGTGVLYFYQNRAQVFLGI